MGYQVHSYDPNGAALAEEEQDAGSYIGRHWRGHLPLAQSYWLNGFITNGILLGLAAGLIAVEQTGRSLRLLSFAFVLYVLLFLLVRTWAFVGIWRSAGRHAARGGAAAWGTIARVIVGIGVLGTLGQIPALGVQAREHGLIAIGRDPIGPVASMSLDETGQTLELKGNLSAGAADAFEAMIGASPDMRLVALDSDGGRIFEALRMAELIRARGLDTRVEQHCASACTLLLLAGKERSAHRFAQIGFHQPDFPGISEADRAAVIEDNRQDYIASGIAPAFLDRALSTPPAEMWYPTHAELVDAGVLSAEEITVGPPDHDLDRLRVLLARLESEVNADRGVMLDDLTRLDGARLTGLQLRTSHSLTRPFSRSEAEQLRDDVELVVTEDLCNSPKRGMIETGAVFGLDYFNPDGQRIATITIDECPAEDAG